MPIFFLSDFGHRDAYVGIVKAVMAQIAPKARVIDLAHDVPPQDLRAGAYQLFQAVPYLEEGSVVLAVVDPGVGSTRRAIVAEGRRLSYVAPDNGLLSLAFERDPPARAFLLEAPDLRLKTSSATFHGRDVFGPAAAHLACGVAAERFGPAVSPAELVRLPFRFGPGPEGEILSFDRFGNAITTLLAAGTKAATVEVGRLRLPLRAHYVEVAQGEPLALCGSAGLVEISIREGNARNVLGLREGMRVSLAPPTT